jgi:hypothetical protein
MYSPKIKVGVGRLPYLALLGASPLLASTININRFGVINFTT